MLKREQTLKLQRYTEEVAELTIGHEYELWRKSVCNTLALPGFSPLELQDLTSIFYKVGRRFLLRFGRKSQKLHILAHKIC